MITMTEAEIGDALARLYGYRLATPPARAMMDLWEDSKGIVYGGHTLVQWETIPKMINFIHQSDMEVFIRIPASSRLVTVEICERTSRATTSAQGLLDDLPIVLAQTLLQAHAAKTEPIENPFGTGICVCGERDCDEDHC